MPSVCQFVPLTESSSTASLDQLASHEGSLHQLAKHGLRGNRSEISMFPPHTNNVVKDTQHRERFSNNNRNANENTANHTVTHRNNTYAKFGNMSGVHGRHDAGHYDTGHYNKNVTSRNPYSRKNTGKLSHSLLYSGNSTLHSTLASSSPRPAKSGHSTTTTKNSTGSSQLTTSAYLSSSSESRLAKSNVSFPVRTPKSPHRQPPAVNHYPSLPHMPHSNASMVVMMPPPPPPAPSSLQYPTIPQHRSRPQSERYYAPSHRSAPQPQYARHHPQMFHQQQYLAPTYHHHHPHPSYNSGYYTLQHNAADPMAAYQSLPHPHTQYIQGQQLRYSHAVHPNQCNPQYVANSMPGYGYLQVCDIGNKVQFTCQ